MQYNVLFVSNDVNMASLWIPLLSQASIAATIVELSDARNFEFAEAYALVILDVYSAVPHVLELVQHIRAGAAVPILLLTPASSEAYQLGAYKAGVTYCLVRPVSPALFLAKVRALLNIMRNEVLDTPDVLQVGALSLNADCRVVIFADGRETQLTRLECKLLALLMRNAGQTLETNTLIERVWGCYKGDPTVLKNVVYRLRKKIEPDPKQPRYIVWKGEGYAFFPQSQDS